MANGVPGNWPSGAVQEFCFSSKLMSLAATARDIEAAVKLALEAAFQGVGRPMSASQEFGVISQAMARARTIRDGKEIMPKLQAELDKYAQYIKYGSNTHFDFIKSVDFRSLSQA